MSNLEKHPEKCKECLLQNNKMSISCCDFCKKIDFKEEILCDLNRMSQDFPNFHCHAYQPKLRIANSGNFNEPETKARDKPKIYSIDEILKTYQFNSPRQEALMKLDFLSDDCRYVDIRFHYVFNVLHRNPLFSPKNNYSNIYNAFLNCSKLIRGFSYLLWLSSDHVHVYVETDGEQSVEVVTHKLLAASNAFINTDKASETERHKDDQIIWSDEYFVESVTAGNLGFL